MNLTNTVVNRPIAAEFFGLAMTRRRWGTGCRTVRENGNVQGKQFESPHNKRSIHKRT